MNQTPIKDATVEQLKATGYDLLIQRNLVEQKLTMINEELAKRAEQTIKTQETEKTEEEKKEAH